jgi:hypothetical protein
MNVLRLARLFPATQFASGDAALLEIDGCSLTHNVELRLCATRFHALERVARAIGKTKLVWLCTTRLPLPLSQNEKNLSERPRTFLSLSTTCKAEVAEGRRVNLGAAVTQVMQAQGDTAVCVVSDPQD